MTRAELETMLGKEVEVELNSCSYANSKLQGILQKSGDEKFKERPELFLPANYYFLTDSMNPFPISPLFRVSHIKSCKVKE